MRVLILAFVVLVATLLNVVSGETTVVLKETEEILSKWENAAFSQMKKANKSRLTPSLVNNVTVSSRVKTHITSAEITENNFHIAAASKIGVASDGFFGTSMYNPTDVDCSSPNMMMFDRLGVCSRQGGTFKSHSLGMQVTWGKKSSEYYISTLDSNFISKDCTWVSYIEPNLVLGLDTCFNFDSTVFSNHYESSNKIYKFFTPPAQGVVYTRYGSAGGCRNRNEKDIYSLVYFSTGDCRNDDEGEGYYKFTCNENNEPVMEEFGDDSTCTNMVSSQTPPPDCQGLREPSTFECVDGVAMMAKKNANLRTNSAN